ncbi:Uncharacterised protein [Klebsiella pneumoniae]|nr:Uncharacterised protein [Klebsiella pneumoniae]
MLLQAVRAHGGQPAPGRSVHGFVSFRVQPSQQAGVLHDDRQHPCQRPEADRTHENQPPDSHVDPAQHIKQAAHQQGEGPQHHAAHDVAGGEEGEQQRQHRGGQRPGEDDGQGDADLRKVIAERPVPEVVPDEHPRQVAANLLQAGGQLFAADAELQKKPDVIEQAGQRHQPDVAQVAPLDLIELLMLPPAGGDIRLHVPDAHFFPSSTHRRRRPDSMSSADTTRMISSRVMLT